MPTKEENSNWENSVTMLRLKCTYVEQPACNMTAFSPMLPQSCGASTCCSTSQAFLPYRAWKSFTTSPFQLRHLCSLSMGPRGVEEERRGRENPQSPLF